MSKPAGSPRGTIHLYPAGSCPAEIENGEIEEKQDDRGSIGEQIERIQKGTEKIAKQLYAMTYATNSFYDKSLHPYVDPCPRDDTPHLFILYADTPGFNTSRPGFVKLMLDGERLRQPSLFEFFGTTTDFIHQSIHAIPDLSHVYICVKDMIPESIYRILAHEYPKIGVRVIDDTKFGIGDGKLSEKITEDSQTYELTPHQRSQIQDGYHKLRGFPVASRRGRILRIAMYVARTPEDEKNGPDEEWAIFPDEPTKAGEPDTIAKFKSRDEAARELNKMENQKTKLPEETEESTIASDSLQANIMHDWMSPEEAVEAAWSLRDESKRYKSPEEEGIQ